MWPQVYIKYASDFSQALNFYTNFTQLAMCARKKPKKSGELVEQLNGLDLLYFTQ